MKSVMIGATSRWGVLRPQTPHFWASNVYRPEFSAPRPAPKQAQWQSRLTLWPHHPLKTTLSSSPSTSAPGPSEMRSSRKCAHLGLASVSRSQAGFSGVSRCHTYEIDSPPNRRLLMLPLVESTFVSSVASRRAMVPCPLKALHMRTKLKLASTWAVSCGPRCVVDVDTIRISSPESSATGPFAR